MKDLVLTQKGERFLVDTRDLSTLLDVENRALIATIRKHEDRFSEFGIITFEMGKIKGAGRGRPEIYSLLNEDQSYFLLTMSRNTGKVVSAKHGLVKAFRKARKEVERLHNMRSEEDWIEARENGKAVRRGFTGAIKILRELAVKQGSNYYASKDGKNKIYSTYTRMIYKAMYDDSKLKQIRDKMSKLQLSFLGLVEESCAQQIFKMVDLGLDYHDIYNECRIHVIQEASKISGLSITDESDSIVKLVKKD